MPNTQSLLLLSTAVFLAFSVTPASAQTKASIYLINGMVPGQELTMYSADLSTGHVAPGVTLARAEDDSDFVAPDYDLRTVIVGTGENGAASQLIVLPMDHPSEVFTEPVTYPEGFTAFFSGVVHPASRNPELLIASTNGSEVRYFGYPLTPGGETRSLPASAAAGLMTHDLRLTWGYELSYRDGKLLFLNPHGNVPLALPDPALPDNVRDKDVFLMTNDEAVLVVTTLEEQTYSSDALGSSVFHIYAKGPKTWTALKLPGSGTRMNVVSFGPWLAFRVSEDPPPSAYTEIQKGERVYNHTVHRESPGKEERIKNTVMLYDWRHGAQKMNADSLFFQDYAVYYPGTLVLYNADTGQRFNIETNQGDSEILLVDGSEVYYRSNMSLYRVRIGDGVLTSPEKVAEGHAVGNAHWAFVPHTPSATGTTRH